MEDFLLEIGTEEIPASYVGPAAEQMRRDLLKFLDDSGVKHGDTKVFYTPRRLALLCEDLAPKQEDAVLQITGPPKSSAYDKDGKPTKAAEGFARAHGVDVNKLKTKKTDKGEVIVVTSKRKGKPTSSLLSEYLPKLMAGLHFPKSMRWEPSGFRFARPIRGLVALLGRKVVKFSVADVKPGDKTYGHRFLSPGPKKIDDPRKYERILKEKHVIADPEKRKEMILSAVKKAAAKKDGIPIEDAELLGEVNGLVEEPNPIAGSFDEKYLKLPKDLVVTAMGEHQRYFSIVNRSGKLLPHFVAISNGKTGDDKGVRKVYEDILVSKLEDASFHWQEDTKQKLEKMAEGLKRVVWQENLGTVYDKSERLVELAKQISLRIDEADSTMAERAALLCKADLVSNMVRDGKEFAKLQGAMGREYALVSGEDKKVATAIYEHYLPRYPGDTLPRTPEGAVVSIADRLDSIVGSFINKKIPSGSEDPYGLRRLANGMIAVVVNGRHHLSLTDLIAADISLYEVQQKLVDIDRNELGCSLFSFLVTRMEAFLEESGIRYDITDAVMSPGLDDLADAAERAKALSRFREREEFKRLVTGQKRVANILKGLEIRGRVDESMLTESEEQSLYSQTRKIEENLAQSISKHEYEKSLKTLLTLRAPIDKFFDAVLVMAEDEKVKANRLALVKYVADKFSMLADLSRVIIE